MLHDRVEEQESLQDDYKLKPSALASLSGPEGPLELFKSTIETILTPQAGFQRPAQPFTWPFDKKEITEHLVTIERFKSHFTLVLQNDFIALSKLANEKIRQISKHKNIRPTLEQICDIFKREFSGHDFIHVVIDALDECTLSDELAIKLVETVRKLCTNIRLLITSRPSTTFEDYFEPMKRIKITAHDKDIRLYLEQQSLAQPRLARHIRADPSLQEDSIRTITEGSRGMFLLAALHLELLSRKITRRDAEEDVELAETIIHWVLCALQLLSVFELQHMYALWMLLQDEHEVIELEDDNLPPRETVTGVCGGLIVIDAMSNSVRLVHYTAQDYLRRTHQDSLSQRQLELTEISVHYLGLAEFSDGPAMSDADMADRLTRFPFLNYAANYWGVEIDEVQSENFWKPLNRFLSNQVAVSVANQVWSLPHHRYVRWSQDYPANVPALVLASSFELPDVLHKLVEQGHSIEGCGSDGETPLIRAARLGHAGNVAKLIRFGANVASTDVAGETAIERAASIGNSAAVKALLEGGAEANTTDHTVGWTVLIEKEMQLEINLL
ncbi:ankyrin [Colletotrichum sublineola]|nr:ankyrin [Colletotrichum sublineola]